ncbi:MULTISPECIES: hypothetical protein [Streptomyces violaceusniger group]|uniref:DUF3970 domain-containing protein n=1 Tax=Streptomyces malaysiensis TaxID=92644 RepID=A0A2J7Z9Q6_STRMQ|nr:hypothetical protein [Streptomyces malaysiensis]MCQ6249275.1 hypothetical protein [Streptomyces malaysiensis]PNG97010.1 hypothetical protein SMF913_13035 [Streptomyces malaysiensis]
MKIRVMATEEEAAEVVNRLRQVLTVVEVSGPYRNRRGDSDLVRVYVEVRL